MEMLLLYGPTQVLHSGLELNFHQLLKFYNLVVSLMVNFNLVDQVHRAYSICPVAFVIVSH